MIGPIYGWTMLIAEVAKIVLNGRSSAAGWRQIWSRLIEVLSQPPSSSKHLQTSAATIEPPYSPLEHGKRRLTKSSQNAKQDNAASAEDRLRLRNCIKIDGKPCIKHQEIDLIERLQYWACKEAKRASGNNSKPAHTKEA
ncbi:unnamed protein product [Dovyalis caffra]|uniref:Uncharacterized protein n=1 Tax=Dovyalis caffra TaxID=77055 RepID=A0AAV1S879_9ROSI|nr:unnamed protein product [Dovyalis caffra]